MLPNKKRQYVARPVVRMVRNLGLTLCLVSLAGCADRITHWSPRESPKANKVSWAEFHHPVYFSRSSDKLDKAEQTALARFLMRNAQGDGVRVMLATGSENPSPLSQRRESSLASHLMAQGFSVSRIRSNRRVSERSDAVRVTVGRYIVTPPNCPDWSKESTGDPFNRVTSNFRCANVSNLGLMVANPESLIRGTRTGPADGEAAALGVTNYRKGEIEEAQDTSAKEAIGGGGASGE